MQFEKLKIIYFGNNKIYLQVMNQNEIISAVFCNPDVNSKNVMISDLKIFTSKYNIPLFQPLKINDDENLEIIKKLNPDLIVVGGYKFIIPKKIFSIPRLGAINIHPSYLPKYRGQHVINWAIINGETKTGITIHFLDESIDTGDIIMQKIVEINQNDTSKTLSNRLYKIGGDLLKEVLRDFKINNVSRVKQNESQATYFKPRKPSDGRIDWNKSPLEIYNLVRALVQPWPGAFTFYHGKKFIIYDSIINNEILYSCPGEIINIANSGIEVAAKKGTLIVKMIENEDKLSKYEFEIGDKFY